MWKLPYINPVFFSKNFKAKKAYKIFIRNSIIPKNYFSKSFDIYNGKKFINVVVKPEMAGNKLGEFSITKVLGFKKKKKKK